MAKGSNAKRVSLRPSKMEKGQAVGIPVGAICTITELTATTWEEAGEKAIKGGRAADDPALKITVEIKGVDEPVTEFLGCGKGNRLQPSRDGEFFEPANEDLQIEGLPESSNTGVFIASIFDRKRHGKNTPDEALTDDGFSALVGLVFRAGKEVVKREGLEPTAGERGPRPTLVCAEVLEGPGAKKSSSKRKGKPVEDEDDEEEDDDPKPAKKRRGKPVDEDEDDEDDGADDDEDDDEEPEETPRGKGHGAGSSKKRGASQGQKHDDEHEGHGEAAERAIAEALDLPKYRKGIPLEKVFSVVFTAVRDKGPAAKRIAGVVDLEEGGEDWIKHEDRPWQVVEKKIDGETTEVIVSV